MKETPPDLTDRLHGTLLGTAYGDATGLPFENLSPRRVAALAGAGNDIRYGLLPGFGIISDDTEHAILVAQAVTQATDDTAAFRHVLAKSLRWWLASLPPGVGSATLRSILRLWVGVSPERSGVMSAGNGPSMRAPVIGVLFRDKPETRIAYVRASTKLTHADPKAEIAAHACARLAACAANGQFVSGVPIPWATVRRELLLAAKDAGHLPCVDADAWSSAVKALGTHADNKTPPLQAAADIFGPSGPSGYSLQSIPAAVYAWWWHHDDPVAAVETAIRMGGDTDSVAALAGAMVGAGTGVRAFPSDLVAGMRDWPRGHSLIARIAENAAAAVNEERNRKPVPYPLWPLPFRNIVIFLVVVCHVFRRLGPPYR
jgi:ADP-ribosylglycohydrolase